MMGKRRPETAFTAPVRRSPQVQRDPALRFFQHQLVSIANIFFQLLERRALAKDVGYLWEAADVPVAILPILKAESNSL